MLRERAARTVRAVDEGFDDGKAAAIGQSLWKLIESVARDASVLGETTDEARLKRILRELEKVKNQVGLIDKAQLAAWLGPVMSVALLSGIYTAQSDAEVARRSAADSLSPLRRGAAGHIVANAAGETPAPPQGEIQGGFFIRPHEAIQWFREKKIVTPDEFYSVDASTRARSFTVGQLADEYSMGIVQDEIGQGLQDGLSPSAFLTRLEERFQAAGLSMPGGSDYWRVVYDANATLALSAGRYIQQMRSVEQRPFWEFWNPDPVTLVCTEMNGKVYRADDPIWKTHYPPLHFGCKSMVITLDGDELAEDGREVSSGSVVGPVAEGWGYNPAESFFLSRGSNMPQTPEGVAAMKVLSAKKPEVPAWKPAATLADAEAEVREENGVARVVYSAGSKSKLWGAAYKSEADRLAKLNDINRELARLRQEFPTLPKNITHTLVVTSHQTGRANFGSETPTPWMAVCNNRTEKQIAAIAEWEKQNGRRWGAAGEVNHTAGNLRHELAHNLSQFPDLSDWDRAVRQVGWKRSDIMQNLSEYAAKSPKEAIAEAFTLYTAPGYVRGTLPEQIEAVIRSMLGV